MAGCSSSGHGCSEHTELGHVVPFKTYLGIFVTLLVLTVITVAVARYDFDAHFGTAFLNITVAMFVASIKAFLVATVFMHLKYEDKITWIYATFPLILLAILLAGVFIDNPTRTNAKYGTYGKAAMEAVRTAPAVPAAKH